MRILFYLPSFGGGGAERNTVLIANEWMRQEHEVFIAVDHDEGPNRYLLDNGVHVQELGHGRHFADLISLRRVIRDFKPDVIYARLGLSPIKIFIASIGNPSSRNIIISYHTLYNPGSKIGGRLTYWLASILSRKSLATIAVSADIRSELVEKFGSCKRRTIIIHNPVNIPLIEAMAKEKNDIVHPNSPYILSLGRLVEQKDYGTLILAFSEIAEKTDHHLVILGEGPLRPELENLIIKLNLIDRVHLPGYAKNPFPLYKGASLFVLSSALEGFGNVLIEAMAMGIPVVATDCPGGPKDILANGRYGPLVRVGDVSALASAMITTLRAPLAPSQLQARAADFSVDKIATAYLSVSDL